jgi:hypothetical protein
MLNAVYSFTAGLFRSFSSLHLTKRITITEFANGIISHPFNAWVVYCNSHNCDILQLSAGYVDNTDRHVIHLPGVKISPYWKLYLSKKFLCAVK